MKGRVLTYITVLIMTMTVIMGFASCKPEDNTLPVSYSTISFRYDFGIEDYYTGKTLSNLTLPVNSDITGLEAKFTPETDTHIFEGWFTKPSFDPSDKFIFDKMPETDTVLFAKWSLRKKSTLTFVTNDMRKIEPLVYYIGEDITTVMPDMSKFDRVFLGWYSDPSFAEDSLFDLDKMPASDMKLYAKWQDFAENTTFIVDGEVVAVLPSSQALSYEYNDNYHPDLMIEGWYLQSNINTLEKVDLKNDDLSGLSLYGNLYSKDLRFDGSNVVGYESDYSKVVIPWAINGNLITGISNNAFLMKNMTTLKLPSTIRSIGDGAFYGCANLQEINLSDGLRIIGSEAFVNCRQITELYIPESLQTAIAPQIFKGCDSLERFIFSANNSKYRMLSQVIYNKNLTEVIMVMPAATAVTIAPTVETIRSYSLLSYRLEEIVLPPSVKTIENNSINYDNKNLRRLTLPAVGNSTIYDDENNKIVFSLAAIFGINMNSDISLGEETTPSIPASLENVTLNFVNAGVGFDYSFFQCSDLKQVNLPDDMTEIGDYCFYGCSGITSMKIPANVRAIGNYAFAECDNLATIIIGEKDSGSKLHTLGECALFVKDDAEIYIYCEEPPLQVGKTAAFREKVNIYVRKSFVSAYVTAIGLWRQFAEDIKIIEE